MNVLPWILLALVAGDAKAAPATQPSALHVSTFNIRYDNANDGENRWANRRELVAKTVRSMDPDLIGFQEVVAHQGDALKEDLPAYVFLGTGREDGKRKGEMSMLGFRRDRFEQLADGRFWLSEKPDEIGLRGWDAQLPRMVTWVRLRDRISGNTLLFADTHFDHKGREARLESAKLLRSRVESLRENGLAIVVGDFNATEDDPPYASLLGDPKDPKRWMDARRAVQPTRLEDEGTFHGFKGGPSKNRIDWIVYTPGFKATACDAVRDSDGKRYPSDHYPVAATLTFTPAGANAK